MLSVWKTLTILEHYHPLEKTLKVTICEMPKDEDGGYNYTEDDETHHIKISSRIHDDAHAETLVHEYAHALLCDYTGPSSAAVWGVCYSGLYNLIFEEH